jgi:hypothetical protein
MIMDKCKVVHLIIMLGQIWFQYQNIIQKNNLKWYLKCNFDLINQ